MDFATAFEAVSHWPAKQQLELAYKIIDRVYEASEAPPPSEAREQELKRRLAHLAANPQDVYTLEEMRKHFNLSQ